MMRLVVDYDEDEREKPIHVNTPTELPDEPSAEPDAAPKAAGKKRRKSLPPEPVEATEESAEAVGSEEVDGPVVDESADDEAADVAGIDLGVLEALLFSTHHPLTAPRLAELMEMTSAGPLRKAIKTLNAGYAEGGRAFRIEQVAGGFQMLTLPEYGEHLKRLHQKDIDTKLTKAAIETLAIIAYKQPILRADLEAIRGVASGETIRSLMEKHLVRIAGRAEEPGRPILYGTTKRFLELFGLNTLKDLPQGEELLPPKQA